VAMQEALLGVTLEQRGADGTVNAVIQPPLAGLDRAKGSVPTIAGPVQLAWERHGKGMTMDLTVPANARATVRLGAGDAASLREGGTAVARTPGVTVMPAGAGVVVLSVGSGSYRFTSS